MATAPTVPLPLSTDPNYIFTDGILLDIISTVSISPGENDRFPYLQQALQQLWNITIPLIDLVETHVNADGDVVTNSMGIPQYFLRDNHSLNLLTTLLKNAARAAGTETQDFEDDTTMETHCNRLLQYAFFFRPRW